MRRALRRSIPQPAAEWVRARRAAPPVPTGADDVVFVVAPQNRGEILEGVCHQIAPFVPGTHSFHYGLGPPPPARTHFFSHWSLYRRARDLPQVRAGRSIVYFTHPSYEASEARKIGRVLRTADRVIAMSSPMQRHLIESGVPMRTVSVIIGGADPDEFPPHERGQGIVGFHSKYVPRKSSETVLGIVCAMPHRRFRLTGRRWSEASEFEQLVALPNFEYADDERATPDFYRGIDVFVSPSVVEGGPVPLIEAMMSNVVPVSSRTGVAVDVIEHGVNGFVCDVGSSPDVYAGLIDTAFELQTDVRATVEHLTWEAFARDVVALMPATYADGGAARR